MEYDGSRGYGSSGDRAPLERVEYDGSLGYGSSGDRAHLLESVLVISSFLRERGMILTAVTQEELLVALGGSKKPIALTKKEWAEFGQHWLDGGWMDMQWYDTSEAAVDDAEWYDFTEEDAFYPYDENLVMRFKK